MQSLTNVRSALAKFLGKQFSGNRDLYETYGYPRQILSEELYAMYLRNEIASRIIRGFSKATWADMPEIYSDDEQFNEEWKDLYERWNLANKLERADRLSTIGYYGILVMGFADGKSLSEPLESGNAPLIYLTPYSDKHIQVSRWDMDQTSPRFGKPELYTAQTGSFTHGGYRRSKSVTVHHSRVLHLAEQLDEDDVYGVPRLMPVFNRLMDLEKLAGGSAETYWLVSNRGLALIADAEADLSDEDKEKAKAQVEEYQHQMRRVMALQGMSVQNLGSETADPSAPINAQLDLIAGGVGFPKRLLTGSERGELASSQDGDNWQARITERRSTYAAPNILRPFIQKMIETGNMKRPDDLNWKVAWEDDDGVSAKEKAEIWHTKMRALREYASAPGGEEIVTREEWRKSVGLTPEPEGGFLEIEEEIPEEGED